MKIVKYPSPAELKTLLTRPAENTASIEEKVFPILQAVKERGDAAVLEFGHRFDGNSLTQLAVSEQEIREAYQLVDEKLKSAIQVAINNVHAFHLSQKEEIKYTETTKGVTCWRKSIGIQKVGLYIPGGSAPLFSTVIMLGVPAVIAGCEEIVLCSPAGQDGKIHPAILYVADVLGIKKIFKTGGAQAIAAMTWGTQTIPGVYKIFGPGNQYVTAAKQVVSRSGVAIDMPAGPSEVMIVADHTAPVSFVAADLLSQAEHGPDSQVILVTTDETLAEKVLEETRRQASLLSRSAITFKALENSNILIVRTEKDVVEIINDYAPEHLILALEEPEQIAEKVINAGSVFLGHYTPESAGDYASGTNHTLPTNGYARAYSGVSLDSFVKKVTFQKISEEGIRNIGPVVETMAAGELLDAHKNAVTYRLKTL